MTSTTMTDKKWLDELTIALRLRDVRGTAIGDALAAAETHCAESGESMVEAFGDPKAYADSLEFPDNAFVTTTPTEWRQLLAPIAAGIVAINLARPVTLSFLENSGFTITRGWIAALLVLAAVIYATMKLLPALVDNFAAAAIFLGLSTAGISALGILWTTPAFQTSNWVGLAVLLALLAWSVIGQRSTQRNQGDLLIDPRNPKAPAPGSRLLAATQWLFVFFAAVNALLTWLPFSFK